MREADATGTSEDAATADAIEAAASGYMAPDGLAPAALERLTDRVYGLLLDDLRRQRERAGLGRWR